MAKVIKLFEKLSAAQQLSASLTPSTLSMMSGDDKCFVCGWTGHSDQTALMPNIMAVMNLVTLPKAAPTKFLHQEHHATTADLIQGIITTTTIGTDHTPIMVPHIGDDTADHRHAPIQVSTKVAVLEGTPHALLPATAATWATLQLMNTPITPHAIATPHPTFATSLASTAHAILWTTAGLTPADPTTQQKDTNPGKSSNVQDSQLP